MSEEIQNGEAAPESTEAPAGSGAEQQNQNLEPPRAPREAPPEGTKYVFDNKMNVWHLRRDEHYKPAEEQSPEQQRPTPDSKAGEADESGGLQLAEHLPAIIREDPAAPEMLRDVSTVLDDSRIEAGAKQRLVDIAMDLHSADLEAGMPPLWNQEANEGVLRQRWGKAYDERVARAQAAAKALGPKFIAWCNRTGAGNSPALVETLALMADKDKLLALSPEQAAAKMKEWRSDPKHPLRNSLHPEHAVALAKARVLAIMAEGKGRQGNVEELVQDRQEAETRAKEEPLDDATAKLDAELKQLRLDPAYFDSSKPNHKPVVARVRELYRQRWAD